MNYKIIYYIMLNIYNKNNFINPLFREYSLESTKKFIKNLIKNINKKNLNKLNILNTIEFNKIINQKDITDNNTIQNKPIQNKPIQNKNLFIISCLSYLSYIFIKIFKI